MATEAPVTLADYQLKTLDISTFRHAPGFGPRTDEPGRVLWTVSDYFHVLADGMEYRCKALGRVKQGEAGLPVVGDPEHVANHLIDLGKAGLTGIAISLVNYLDELPFFCDEVLPRLERAVLREKR